MAKKADTEGEAKLELQDYRSDPTDAIRSMHADLQAQVDRVLASSGSAHEQLAALREQMAALGHGVAELLEHTRALHVQRPRSLTKTEVEQLLKAKPDQSYIVCAPFSAGSLSFRPGDRIDARTRFANPDHLALHVERGLQLTIPPQA
jgi:ElaB/YqjD/DUF883 family membrane-anchored ribosome-binding protein